MLHLRSGPSSPWHGFHPQLGPLFFPARLEPALNKTASCLKLFSCRVRRCPFATLRTGKPSQLLIHTPRQGQRSMPHPHPRRQSGVRAPTYPPTPSGAYSQTPPQRVRSMLHPILRMQRQLRPQPAACLAAAPRNRRQTGAHSSGTTAARACARPPLRHFPPRSPPRVKIGRRTARPVPYSPARLPWTFWITTTHLARVRPWLIRCHLRQSLTLFVTFQPAPALGQIPTCQARTLQAALASRGRCRRRGLTRHRRKWHTLSKAPKLILRARMGGASCRQRS